MQRGRRMIGPGRNRDLVWRLSSWGPEYQIEVKLLESGLGHGEMSPVGRVERAPQDP